jgi:hypothetical protein
MDLSLLCDKVSRTGAFAARNLGEISVFEEGLQSSRGDILSSLLPLARSISLEAYEVSTTTLNM